eukprot:scaffold1642_cov252-Pinguiococcus_pyrenoidosus.AAC.17
MSERLGNLAGRAQDIMDHPYFDDVDWDALREKRATPPWMPPTDFDRRPRVSQVCHDLSSVLVILQRFSSASLHRSVMTASLIRVAASFSTVFSEQRAVTCRRPPRTH